MQLEQLMSRQCPQPEEKLHAGVLKVLRKVSGRLELRLLQHVRGGHSPLQPMVETAANHAAKSVGMLPQQVTQRLTERVFQ